MNSVSAFFLSWEKKKKRVHRRIDGCGDENMKAHCANTQLKAFMRGREGLHVV